MFPDYILNNEKLELIRDFVVGSIRINAFAELLYKDDALFDYLQSIIDYMEENDIQPKRQTFVDKRINYGLPYSPRSHTEDLILKYRHTNKLITDTDPNYCPTVKEYLKHHSHKTASGAYCIHETISDIYFQIDSEKERTSAYHDDFEFCLDVMPPYLCGGVDAENYISEHIIVKLPADMKKSEKKKLVKEEIRRLFRRETKGYPQWIQMPAWPIGANNKPMIYIRQVNRKASTEHDDYSEYYFADAETGEERIIRQYW